MQDSAGRIFLRFLLRDRCQMQASLPGDQSWSVRLQAHERARAPRAPGITSPRSRSAVLRSPCAMKPAIGSG